MRRFKILLIVVLGSLLILPFGIYGGVSAFLTPSRLTELVNKYGNQYLNAHIEVDTVALSMFSEFPYVGIKLSNGSIISEVFKDLPEEQRAQLSVRADSLLKFGEIMASISIPGLLRGNVDVRRLRIVEPDLYAYVSPWGLANWDIFSSSEESEQDEGLDFNINRIVIRDSKRIAYNDRQSLYYVNAELKSLYVGGNITTDSENFELTRLRSSGMMMVLSLEPEKFQGRVIIDTLRLGKISPQRYEVGMASKLSVVVDDLKYCSRTPLNINGEITVRPKEDSTKLNFHDLDISIANVPFNVDGSVTSAAENFITELSCRIGSFDVEGVLDELPQESFPELKKISTGINIDSDIKITGTYNPELGRLPSFRVDLEIPDGHFAYEGIDAHIRNVEFKGSLFHNPFIPDSTGLSISKLLVAGSGVDMTLSGELSDVLNDPLFKGNLNGSFSLDSLATLLVADEMGEFYGKVDMDMTGSLRMSDLDIAKIGNIELRGNLNTDSLYVSMPDLDVMLVANGSRARFGSGENQMLALSYSADTLNFKFAELLSVEASMIKVRARSAASTLSGDTTRIHPLSGTIEAVRLRGNAEGAYTFGMRELKGLFEILPSPEDQSIPKLKADIVSAGVMARDKENRITLVNPHISLDATVRKREERREGRGSQYFAQGQEGNTRRSENWGMTRAQRLDSLQTLYPDISRDSLIAHNRAIMAANNKDEFSYADIDFSLDKEIRDLFVRWDVSGSISATGGRVATPYFPQNNTLNGLDMHFTTNEITLNSADIVSGDSHLSIEGKISNMRRAILGRAPLKASFDLYSDMLDFSQLYSTALSSMLYMDMTNDQKAELAENEDDQMQEVLQERAHEQSSSLLIIPANIDLDLHLLVNKASYDSILFDRLRGDVKIENRTLQLKGISANSNAGGFDLSAIYTTKNRDELRAGFDLELHDIEVEKLIKVIPAVDSIFPMLRSFEGVLNCQLTAKTDLDTNMNFILPTLSGACRINGDDLVLLDGETFAEIAKTLKFKNREKNIIESIAVELLIKDSRIEVFPFIMQMDRYMAAVSGTHNFDMNFLYHISVIKSPIPLKIGLNVSGNLDDVKIKVGKTLYKNATLPIYTHIIDQERINLKDHILGATRKEEVPD